MRKIAALAFVIVAGFSPLAPSAQAWDGGVHVERVTLGVAFRGQTFNIQSLSHQTGANTLTIKSITGATIASATRSGSTYAFGTISPSAPQGPAFVYADNLAAPTGTVMVV